MGGTVRKGLLGPNREAEQGPELAWLGARGTTMATQRTGKREENLRVHRQATLRALTVVRSQMGVLVDHIAGIEQQIRSVEQNLAQQGFLYPLDISRAK